MTDLLLIEQVASDTLDIRTVATLAAVLLPLGVDLITKQTASNSLKSIINLIGSALITVLSLWINPDGQEVTLWLAVNTFIFAVLTSVVAHKGVWKPTGVSDAVEASTPTLGLGGGPSEPPEDPEVPEEPEEPVEPVQPA